MSNEPIYHIWATKVRRDCVDWKNFNSFYVAVGDIPNNKKHLTKKDFTKPFGPKNYKWSNTNLRDFALQKWNAILAKSEGCSEEEMEKRLRRVSRARFYQLVDKAIICKVIIDFGSVENFFGMDPKFPRKHGRGRKGVKEQEKSGE